jgi:hypothetical protein
MKIFYKLKRENKISLNLELEFKKYIKYKRIEHSVE